MFLIGCSATRVAYNQLDWIVVWYLSDYFTLDDAQENHLKEAVRRNIDWHRRDQLPKYAQLLRAVNRDVTSGVVTGEMLERHYARSIVLWDEFVVHTVPEVSAFFLLLSREQVDEFVKNLEKSNQELWEEYAGKTAEERQTSRQNAVLKGLARIFGRLSAEQKDLVLSYQAALNDVSVEWMASRRQWQQEFRQLIVERPSEPEFGDRIVRQMLKPNIDDTSEYRKLVDENRKIVMSMLTALSGELTDKQRQRFSKRAKGLARNFTILSVRET